MATAPQVWTEKTVEVAGTKLQLVSGGRGKPLLLLHDELGPAGWLRFHEALAKHYTLYLPSHPGFGKSEQLNWIMGMRDMAGWYLQALDELDLGQVNVVGLSLGGWLAAEMAAMCPHHFSRMVLVDSPGILPLSGEIFDMFMTVPRDYITRASSMWPPLPSSRRYVQTSRLLSRSRRGKQPGRDHPAWPGSRICMTPIFPTCYAGSSPNPPMDRDGRREDSGRGEGVTGAMIRARIWVDGRLAGGLQALLGAPMAAYSGCGERDGGIGHGKRRSRTGLARVCGDVGLAGGSVADGRRQAGSGLARSRARARLNCSSQGQRRGRCRVNRRAERVIRPAKAKTRRLRVLVVTIC